MEDSGKSAKDWEVGGGGLLKLVGEPGTDWEGGGARETPSGQGREGEVVSMDLSGRLTCG